MKTATKTPLFGAFRKALRLALAANKTQTTAQEVVERAEESALTRRQFLENMGKTMLISGFSGLITEGVSQPLQRSFFSKNPPRIAIIGAGLAGLNALHTFKKAGFDATIYEASGRTSGRILSVHKAMGEGTWTEFGAEFIDTNHQDMWDLAKEFDLELMDLGQASETQLTKEIYFFEGKNYTLAQVVDAFRGFADTIKADVARLPNELSYKTTDPFARQIDQMSISEYLEKVGATGWIKTFIETAYESEYGMSPQDQSAINLIGYISTNTEGGKFDLYGDSDERYKVKGGNQRIPEALAKKYANYIELHRSLESIKRTATHYNLTFSGLKNAVKADFVLIAIPFTRLRNVDIRLEMPQVKWDAINNLGYGTNAKLMLGMTKHFWRAQGNQGLCFSDVGIPNGWDNAQLQTKDDETAGLSILIGGAAGLALGNGTPQTQKDVYLPRWEKVFKGATEHFNGNVSRMHWPSHPYALGSYTSYKKGQYTSIAEAESLPIGHVFFAGEHCGGIFSGYMNGAAKSGREAAEAILAASR